MKEWRVYFSDLDGHWEILIDSTAEEETIHTLSENGNEATMSSKRAPGDVVSVSIISASKEFDIVTGRIGLEKHYYLKIESLRENWYCISSKTYLSNDAMKLASLFMDKNSNLAKKLWKMKKLGKEYKHSSSYLRNDGV